MCMGYPRLANVITPEVFVQAQILWDYNALEMPPRDADVLLVMGHADLGVPRRAAALAKQFKYRSIVVSGGVSHEKSPLGEPFGATEAVAFQREMVALGVSAAQISLENASQNTGQNVTFTRDLLAAENIQTVQLVHTPVMRRRAYATAMRQWPGPEFFVTSEQTTLQAYLHGRNPARVITTLVGDTARILAYPALGFQIPQPCPAEVKQALQWLITVAGYDKNLPDGFTEILHSFI